MNDDLLALAFGAGLVAALNPCGFAMLPGYLALVVHGTEGGDTQGGVSGPVRALGRAVLATAAMATGFVAVFGVFSALTVAAAGTVQRYLPYATVAVGLILLGLGAWLLAGRHLGLTLPGADRWAPSSRLGAMLGYGVGYAVASLSCTVGPFLAVTGVGLRSGNPIRAAGIFVAYAAGFTLIVGVLAVATAFTSTALTSTALADRMRRIIPYVNRIGGVLLIVVGVYVSYYGLYEIRLFTAGGNPVDPVIAVAGRVQGTLAGWVHRHGAWPWLLGAGSLVVAAVIRWVAVRFGGLRRSARRATVADAPSLPSPMLPRQGR